MAQRDVMRVKRHRIAKGLTWGMEQWRELFVPINVDMVTLVTACHVHASPKGQAEGTSTRRV